MSEQTAVAKRGAAPLAFTHVESRLPNLAGFIKGEHHKASVMAGLYTNFKKVPKLAECSPESVFMCVAYALTLDLPIGAPRGGITLLPFKGRAVPIIDYRGMETLVYRSGMVQSIRAVPVMAGEEFTWEEGTEGRVVHKPKLDADHHDYNHLIAVYAVAKFKDGGAAVKVLSKKDVEFYRSKSPSKDQSDSPWKNFPVAMAQKTAILRLCNDLPHLGANVNLAVEHEMRVEAGIDTNDLIDITPQQPQQSQETAGGDAPGKAGSPPPGAQDAPPAPPEIKAPPGRRTALFNELRASMELAYSQGDPPTWVEENGPRIEQLNQGERDLLKALMERQATAGTQ